MAYGRVRNVLSKSRPKALCHAYVGCRVSEALAMTAHHVDAERLRLIIKTLRRRPVFRVVPVPRWLRPLPLDASGRF
jgi:integrase